MTARLSKPLFSVIAWIAAFSSFLGVKGLAQTANSQILSLAVEPVGFAAYPFPTKGAEISYYLEEDRALSLSYAKGSKEQLLTKGYAELWLLRYKIFFGAMSHLNLGLGRRTVGQSYEVRTSAGDAPAKARLDVLVGEVSFGNHVNLGPLLVGCDWIGVATPLRKISYEDEFPDDALESKEETDEAAFGRVAFASTMEFMRLFVGVVF